MGVFAEQEKEQKKKDKSSSVQQKQTVQRDLSDVNGPEGGMLPSDVSARIQSKRGSGQRLSDRQIKSYSEKFGRDMSDVHIHTDSESDTISRSLNARAFTIGSDVFLTKGINPEGGGRDAQTMTHELTHVVQQGGHAGFGSLKLGAADTAQEHEAETTAQREFIPEEKDTEKDTVQRGFFSDLGSMVGHNLLGMVGMEDAYNATFGAKHKVQNAVAQLDEGQADEFQSGESKIPDIELRVGSLETQLQSAQDAETHDKVSADLDAKYTELEDLQKKQLEIVQKVDSSITEDDMNQYRNNAGFGQSLGAMALGKLGGSIMGGFAKKGQRGEATAKGMQSAVNFTGRSARYSGKRMVGKKAADESASQPAEAKAAESAETSNAQPAEKKAESKESDPVIAALQQEIETLQNQVRSLQIGSSEGGPGRKSRSNKRRRGKGR